MRQAGKLSGHVAVLLALGMFLFACGLPPDHGAGPATAASAGGLPPMSGETIGPAAAVSAGSGPVAPAQESGLVATEYGLVRGFQDGQTYAYLGLPFAAPPLGALRWQPPAAPTPWAGELSASTFGPPCPQVDDDGNPTGNEDCLQLNVWTPISAAPGAGLPVLVFMHGGGNVQGAASAGGQTGSGMYEGRMLAERGQAVVVTLQYRLGALGFLVHPSLAAESPHGAAGNYGLLDQIAALGFVQRNIAQFGGDPARVLLFGESAGALDTCMLLASPLAAGLFSRALLESGGCSAPPAANRSGEGVNLSSDLGCEGTPDPAACLRAVPTSTLVTIWDTNPISNGVVMQAFGPNVDGYVLPQPPLAALINGEHNPVPLGVGANADEMLPFTLPMSESVYIALVYLLFAPYGPGAAQEALALYPVGTGLGEYPTAREAWAALATDGEFVCPARGVARSAAAGQSESVYRYFFSRRLDSPLYGPLGAFHGLELPFVFQRVADIPLYVPRPEDLALEAGMLGYWTRFAVAGDPNSDGAVPWPTYELTADPYLELGATITAGAGLRADKCDFWSHYAPPVLALRQSAWPMTPIAGQALTYTLGVANAGGDARSVVISDVLDAQVTFAWASDGGQYQDGVVTWARDVISAGQRLTRTVGVVVASVPAGTPIANTVQATAARGDRAERTLLLPVRGLVFLPMLLRNQGARK